MGWLQICVPAIIALAVIVPVLRGSIFRLEEYERLVVFRLGQVVDVRGPGQVVLFPIVESGSKFDIRDDFTARLIASYEAQVGGAD